MKTRILTLALFCFTLIANAQLYIEPYGGYLFSLKPTKITSSTTDETIQLNFGEGPSINLGVGYKFNKSFIIELNFNNQFQKEINQHVSYNPRSYYQISNLEDLQGDISYSSKTHYFAALFGYSVDINKFKFDFKIGPNLMMSSFKLSSHWTKYIAQTDSETDQIYKLETTNEPSLGYAMNLAIKYQIARNVFFSLNIQTVYNVTILSEKKEVEPEVVGDYHLITPEEFTLIDNEFISNYSRIGIFAGLSFII